MKIFPAIDIKDKKCVRLIKGDFEKKTEYETSPIDQAGKYKDHGFKNLHIVDLDGALTGKTVNLDFLEEIVSNIDLKIPHPRMHNRSFVLFPLFEIDKKWKHPKNNKKITQLLNNLPTTSLRSIKIL